MDYLATPKSSRLSPVIVPYLPGFSLDDDDFSSYPYRAGCGQKQTLDITLPARKLASLAQEWLFFGLIDGLLGCSVERSRFISSDGQSIDATALEAIMTQVTLDLRSAYSQGRIETIQHRLHTAVAASKRLERVVTDDEPSIAVFLSIRILTDFISGFIDTGLLAGDFYGLTTTTLTSTRAPHVTVLEDASVKLDELTPVQRLLFDRLKGNGWCHSQIITVFCRTEHLMVYYLSFLDRDEGPDINHGSCTYLLCKAYNTSASTKSARHVVDGCQCALVSLPEKELFKDTVVPITVEDRFVQNMKMFAYEKPFWYGPVIGVYWFGERLGWTTISAANRWIDGPPTNHATVANGGLFYGTEPAENITKDLIHCALRLATSSISAQRRPLERFWRNAAPPTPEVKYLRLLDIWNLLGRRHTTKAEDLPDIIANLTDVRASRLRDFDESVDRIKVILNCMDTFPAEIMYKDYPRPRAGKNSADRWIPSSPGPEQVFGDARVSPKPDGLLMHSEAWLTSRVLKSGILLTEPGAMLLSTLRIPLDERVLKACTNGGKDVNISRYPDKRPLMRQLKFGSTNLTVLVGLIMVLKAKYSCGLQRTVLMRLADVIGMSGPFLLVHFMRFISYLEEVDMLNRRKAMFEEGLTRGQVIGSWWVKLSLILLPNVTLAIGLVTSILLGTLAFDWDKGFMREWAYYSYFSPRPGDYVGRCHR
ncbi:hypothetical protein BN1723_016539 [Verticillium longisporum]|uniref:Uncharacterized protein n=1 Tax=Verticillium longisporum TaxID=100787 RepID=A0A0G4NGC6_VERLO|nr:hypothetical protein BN1723_016539 [Verticillium longisporum]